MKDVAELLNGMRDAGVIADYALFGAAAQMRYTEAVATLDADVLVAVPSPDRQDVLRPIHEYCQSRGFEPEGEAVRVGAWPVQFVPVFSDLTREAVSAAQAADFDGVPFRVLGADCLAVIALSVGSSMTETERLLRRQAEWQHERQGMSWPEEIRQAERLRPSLEAFRRLRLRSSVTASPLEERADPETR